MQRYRHNLWHLGNKASLLVIPVLLAVLVVSTGCETLRVWHARSEAWGHESKPRGLFDEEEEDLDKPRLGETLLILGYEALKTAGSVSR